MLPALLGSPEYIAVIVCNPPVSEDMLLVVAVPPDIVTGEPNTVPSIANITVPVAELGDTVAVKVMGWPTLDGFCEDDMVVVVAVTPSEST